MSHQKLRFVKSFDKAEDAEVAINIAPLIDMLVILVVFLVIAQTVIKLKTIDAGVSAGAASAADPKLTTVETRLFLDRTIHIVKGHEELTIAPVDGTWNFAQLKEVVALAEAKNGIELQAEEGVSYGELVRAMDMLKQVTPNISLGIDRIHPKGPGK